ncbi:PAS domain-containing sensor histidine kinase [Hymenobacter guriensis]|uniref:histidine kinase n=1 Tax=Hymenobacter guriensis TaxID=2793065 RepID=A0ABS0L3J0_9BACT|nr:PAS domain-containing protein [Hymenobacter guriensis]MBG8554667.1 PAS domain-containing protein [Hymenobacter guriensis]
MPAFPASLPPLDDLTLTLLNVSLTGVILFRPVMAGAGSHDIVDLAYEFLNPAARRMLQLPQQPAETFLTLYPNAIGAGIFDFYRNTYNSGEPGRYDVNYQHDGLDNFFHLSAQRSGELLVVSFTDTADQNRTAAEQSLRESQAREQAARATAERERNLLNALLTQAPVAMGVLQGDEHVVVAVNEQMSAIWGYSASELLGQPLLEAVPELQGQGFTELMAEVARTGVPFVGTEVAAQLRQNGRLDTHYFNFVYQPLYDADGALLGVLDLAVDVTAQVLSRHEAQNLNEELAATNEELHAANEEFLQNNAELFLAQQELRLLNEELEARVQDRTTDARRAYATAERHRARLERLFMQAPAAICILNGPDLVYELVNPGYQQLFPGRQLQGKPILEALPEIAGHEVHRTFRQVYETGYTHTEQGLLIPIARPEDGQLEDRYFNYIQQPRFNEQGHIDGVLVFAFEVTQQVEASQAREASAQQLRLITDALPVLISYLDADEVYRFTNKAYEAWFEIPAESLLGRPVREVLGEAAYQAVKGYIDRALAGERLDFEARMPYREGFIRYIHTSYIPDLRGGKVQGFYALVTDVTEQVEARQQVDAVNEQLRSRNTDLAALNQQLTRTNIDLDNFIYTASHDLKAPITNIEGLLHVLQSMLTTSTAAPEVGPVLGMMYESVARFKRTIHHLADVTKLQKEHTQPTTEVALAPVLRDVQLDLAPLLSETGARLTIDVEACPSVRFSVKNLRSVLFNLLSNALKYRRPDRLPEIRVACHPDGDYTVLTVQDNGLGLAPEQLPELFTMFRRLHSHVEGTGLGLYMVKRSVENAGGRVSVTSEPGVGSVFSVYFRRS